MTTAAARSLEPPVAPAARKPTVPFVVVPVRALTIAGFRAWATSPEFPENVRAAFIDQEVFLDMSNEEPRTHVRVKDALVRVIGGLCEEEEKGEFFGDGVLITNEAAGLSNNPDASFYYWKTLRSGKIRYVPRENQEGTFQELEGTPDWVAEVVSDSSVMKDYQQLRAAYHRAGVLEYWIIDVRGEETIFQMLYYRKSGYVEAPITDGWQKSRVFKREFRLVRKRTRMNHWDFKLELRA
jgi:Uma2 family endonuclease